VEVNNEKAPESPRDLAEVDPSIIGKYLNKIGKRADICPTPSGNSNRTRIFTNDTEMM